MTAFRTHAEEWFWSASRPVARRRIPQLVVASPSSSSRPPARRRVPLLVAASRCSSPRPVARRRVPLLVAASRRSAAASRGSAPAKPGALHPETDTRVSRFCAKILGQRSPGLTPASARRISQDAVPASYFDVDGTLVRTNLLHPTLFYLAQPTDPAPQPREARARRAAGAADGAGGDAGPAALQRAALLRVRGHVARPAPPPRRRGVRHRHQARPLPRREGPRRSAAATQGHDVVLVSGALDFLMERLAKHLGRDGRHRQPPRVQGRLRHRQAPAPRRRRPGEGAPRPRARARARPRPRRVLRLLRQLLRRADALGRRPPGRRQPRLPPRAARGRLRLAGPQSGAPVMMNRFLDVDPPAVVSAARPDRGARSSSPSTRKSAPRTIFSGDQLVDVDLPAGTRVIYPRPPLEALKDVDAAIRYAINHPYGTDPLHAKLRPGMKVVIAIDDISLPLPPMRRARRARARAHDRPRAARRPRRRRRRDHHRHLLHRRMTAAEVRHIVGDTHLRRLLARPPLQPRRRRPEGDEGGRHDRARRGGRAQPQGGRERSRHLREPEPRARWTAGTSRSPSASAATRACARTTTRTTMRECHSLHGPASERARDAASNRMGRARRTRRSTSSRSRRRSTTACSIARSSSSTRTRTTSATREKTALEGARASRSTKLPQAARQAIFQRVPVARTASPASSPARPRRCTSRRSQRCYEQYLVPGRGAGRHPRHGHPVHQPVQRELVPEPAPRAGDGAGLPLQPLPGRAAREEGGHDDHHPPLHRPVRQGAPRAVRRVRPQPAPARRATRSSCTRSTRRSSRRTRRTSRCTGRATPTTRPTRSSCGTGARPGGSTSGGSSSSAPTTTTSRSSSAGRRRAR